MRTWNELSRPTQFAVAAAVILMAALLPEIGFVMAFGGVDIVWLLALGVLAPSVVLLRDARAHLGHAAGATRAAFSRSHLANPAVFVASSCLSIAVLVVSGSLAIALLLTAPLAFPASV